MTANLSLDGQVAIVTGAAPGSRTLIRVCTGNRASTTGSTTSTK